MSAQTSSVTAPAETPADLRARVAQLQQALDSRIVIEQAKGVLAERYRLELDTAFALLRSAARSDRIRIRELAAQVVAGRTTPEPILRALPREQNRPRHD
jgi:AmiR/NasT family two-component response regulator